MSSDQSEKKYEYKFEYNFDHPYLETEIDAVAPATSLRLTKTKDRNTKPGHYSTGRAVHSKPVQFGEKTNFRTIVKFKITPDADNTIRSGDGLAFFIVPEVHEFPSPEGGNLGIFRFGETTPGVFAVALDFGFQKDHITLGINIQSRVPKSQIQVPDDFVGKQLTLDVSYDAKSGDITASLQAAGAGKNPDQVKFKSKLTSFLPDIVSVGLASSTSKDAAAIHDVNYWDFSIDGTNLLEDPIVDGAKNQITGRNGEGASHG